MTNDIEHFLYVLIHYRYMFFGELSVQIFCSCLKAVINFLLTEFWGFFLYSEYKSYQTHSFQIFSLSLWHVFLYLNRAVLKNRGFKIGWSLVYQFVLLRIMLLVLNLQNLCLTQKSRRFPPMLPSRSSIISGFTRRSLLCFELIFVSGTGYR